MASPPTVLLSPRASIRLPTTEIVIPPPPPVPAAPAGNRLNQLLPALLAVVGAAVIVLVGSREGSATSPGVLLLWSLLLVGGGAAMSVWLHRSHTAAYRRSTSERIEQYYHTLSRTRDRLVHLLEDQRRVLLDKDPDPVGCASVVDDHAPRLWERSPGEADFLVLRAGLGAQPSSIPVRAPPQPDPLIADPLINSASELATWARAVWGVPVGLPLMDGRSAGVCGSRSTVLETVRALLVQLATHHPPDEVKLVALVPDVELKEWSWLRWLPHTWSDDRSERYLASTREQATALSNRLEALLSRRSEAASPTYVFVVADPSLATSLPLLAESDSSAGERKGTTSVILAANRARLPSTCSTILEVPDGWSDGWLTHPNGMTQEIALVDAAPLPLAERLATTLAALRPHRFAPSSAHLVQVPLLELLGVQTVEELDVLGRWEGSVADRSLAVSIGVRPFGEPLRLDLHQMADGPHGLVGGSSGSGKTAFLQALLLSLAATFHPHELAMLLVDCKGGRTPGPLPELPHVLGNISGLDSNLAYRALQALQAEIERRQALLSAAGCDDLDSYLVRRRKGQSLEPLPHLVLVVDEFAERPDFTNELLPTARLGRHVGLHVIFCTAKPYQAVDDEIWNTARFRVCLRVEQPQDSQAVLKRSDAANLSGSGQGYLQVGDDERFTLFQGAWGGAPYRQRTGGTDQHQIMRVELNGTRHAAGTASNTPEFSDDLTQADALAHYLRQTADEARVDPLPTIWPADL